MRNWIYLVLVIFIVGSCSQNNVKVDNSLQKYFDENKVHGTFGLFNNGNGEFTIYNLNRFKDSTFLPSSTFEIVSSLIGLEKGKIIDEKMVIKSGGAPAGEKGVTADNVLTMEQAFKAPASTYFQEVARQTGKETMQFYLDSLGYGSRYQKPKIGKIDSFWLDNSLKVTTDEQLGLVKKLYFDQLPFQKRTMRIVKDLMVMERNANYTLAYKTGQGFLENGKSLGWMTGWVVENQHPYFFALNLEGAHDMQMQTVAMNISKGILKQLGFFEGKL